MRHRTKRPPAMRSSDENVSSKKGPLGKDNPLAKFYGAGTVLQIFFYQGVDSGFGSKSSHYHNWRWRQRCLVAQK
jgi:hypothetical protein